MTLIPLKVAAGRLGMHYETFRRKRAKGMFRRLKFHRIGGGPLKVDLESVERELRESQVEDPLVS